MDGAQPSSDPSLSALRTIWSRIQAAWIFGCTFLKHIPIDPKSIQRLGYRELHIPNVPTRRDTHRSLLRMLPERSLSRRGRYPSPPPPLLPLSIAQQRRREPVAVSELIYWACWAFKEPLRSFSRAYQEHSRALKSFTRACNESCGCL